MKYRKTTTHLKKWCVPGCVRLRVKWCVPVCAWPPRLRAGGESQFSGFGPSDSTRPDRMPGVSPGHLALVELILRWDTRDNRHTWRFGLSL